MSESYKEPFDINILKPLEDITGREYEFVAYLVNKSVKSRINDIATTLRFARKELKDKSFIINSCKSLSGFGTHNPKIYDPKVKGRVFAPLAEYVSDHPYLYSDTIIHHHNYDNSGSAGYIQTRIFLCTEFIHDGNGTTFYHEFLKTDSKLIRMLREYFELSDEFESIIRSACQRHANTPFPEYVPPYQIQVFVPLAQCEEYISVSPVVSAKVLGAVHNFCIKDIESLKIGIGFHNVQRHANFGSFAYAAKRTGIGVLSPRIKLTRQHSSLIKAVRLLEHYDDLLFTQSLDFSLFLKKTGTAANFITNRYDDMTLTSEEKSKILSRVQLNISIIFSKLDTLRIGYQKSQVKPEQLNKLKDCQKAYIINEKLNADEMNVIWTEANSAVHANIIRSGKYKNLAYHPTLTRYISNAIRLHLKPVFSGNIEQIKPDIETNKAKRSDVASVQLSPSRSYLYLPNISVINAHADNSPFSTGLPAITSIIGFVDEFRRSILKLLNIDFGKVKVCWLLKNYQAVSGTKKHEPNRWRDNKKAPFSDVISRKLCNVVFDVVIECSLSLQKLIQYCSQLYDFLPINFASGAVCADDIFSHNHLVEVPQIYFSLIDLFSYFESLSVSRWMVIDYSENFQRKTGNILYDIADEFSHHNRTNCDFCSMLSLSGIGYKLLENPTVRDCSRGRYHAYVETVVGLQRLKLIDEMAIEDPFNLPIFWSYTYEPEKRLILCKSSVPGL